MQRFTEETPKWHLLVLDDTGEMLALDAKARVGQALSRLLNLVDGLLGQGLRVCWSSSPPTSHSRACTLRLLVRGDARRRFEFSALAGSEVREWLRSEGLQAVPGNGAMTLAELHSPRDGRRAEPRREQR